MSRIPDLTNKGKLPLAMIAIIAIFFLFYLMTVFIDYKYADIGKTDLTQAAEDQNVSELNATQVELPLENETTINQAGNESGMENMTDQPETGITEQLGTLQGGIQVLNVSCVPQTDATNPGDVSAIIYNSGKDATMNSIFVGSVIVSGPGVLTSGSSASVTIDSNLTAGTYTGGITGTTASGSLSAGFTVVCS